MSKKKMPIERTDIVAFGRYMLELAKKEKEEIGIEAWNAAIEAAASIARTGIAADLVFNGATAGAVISTAICVLKKEPK